MATLRERTACVELAMEGERLCKSGDCKTGVQFFEEAVRLGTDDLKTLGAIYSQLGNAYFYLQDYNKAMEYHQHDRTLAKSTSDKIGEAKASGNLANTLKMLGRFDEAIAWGNSHLEISRELNDKVGEARALYNLGNVYHVQGKQGLNARAIDRPPQHPEEAVGLMRKAIQFYEDNLTIVKALGDRAAQGRAYGSLGNTNYLLGNYRDAIKYHQERLAIAKEFGDKPAERRAYSNLGNAHVLLGEYEHAATFYKGMLNLARQVNDRAVEAQSCYSLGNTYTLIGDCEKAVEYHMKHLIIAQELKDRVGECKACWSLSNAHITLGNHEQAMEFTKKQLSISVEVGDETSRITAENNLHDLTHVINREKKKSGGSDSSNAGGKQGKRIRRTSMENMEILRLTPEQAKAMEAAKARKERSNMAKESTSKSLFKDARPKTNMGGATGGRQNGASGVIDAKDVKINVQNARISPDMLEDDNFFDLITRLQGRRMDDQRCEMRLDEDANELPAFLRRGVDALPPDRLENGAVGGQELIGNDGVHMRQRVENGSISSENRHSLDDTFFNALMRCQGTRLNDQRSSPPNFDSPTPTIPDEDFFALIIRMQSSRIEDQRCGFSPDTEVPPNGQNHDDVEGGEDEEEEQDPASP